MAEDELIRIPLAPPPGVFGYAAYATLPATDVDMALIGSAWAADQCEDPLQTTLERYILDGRVATMVVPRGSAPEPPLEMLRAMRLGAEEERRFTRATHVVLVRAPFAFRAPPLCVLGALAVANGIAATFDGVVLDPLVPRLLPLSTQAERLPASGDVTIVKHIVCPMSAEPDGTAWMTTAGMPKFGLPNFEMRFLPPNLSEVLPIMNAIAYRVLREGLAQARRRPNGDPLREVTVPAELRITHADLVGAFGKGNDRGGSTLVRLSWTGRARPELEPFVEIGPPRGFDDAHPAWYPSMLRDFLR